MMTRWMPPIASEHGHRLLANFLRMAGIQTRPLESVLGP